MQESHFPCLSLVHQEVDGLALIAEFTLRVGNLRTDIDQISYLFLTFARIVSSGSVVGTALR